MAATLGRVGIWEFQGGRRWPAPPNWNSRGQVEFSERGGVEADVEWLADRQDLSGAYLGVQGVFAAVEGENGDLQLLLAGRRS